MFNSFYRTATQGHFKFYSYLVPYLTLFVLMVASRLLPTSFFVIILAEKQTEMDENAFRDSEPSAVCCPTLTPTNFIITGFNAKIKPKHQLMKAMRYNPRNIQSVNICSFTPRRTAECTHVQDHLLEALMEISRVRRVSLIESLGKPFLWWNSYFSPVDSFN